MNEQVKHFFRYQFPAIAWAVIIYLISSVPGSKIPKFAHLINDKIIHASIFFIFGLLVYRSLEPRVKPETFNWTRLFISIGAVIIYGLSDEFHQGFVPGRTEDILDATADSVGGICSGIVVYVQYKFREVKS